MTPWPDIVSVNQLSSQASLLLTATFVKGFFIYGIVRLFVAKAKGLSPAHRHLFWFFVVASCLLIPPLALVSPPLRVPYTLPFMAHRGTLGAFLAASSPRSITIPNPVQSAVTGQALEVQASGQSASAAAHAVGGSAAIAVSSGGWNLSRLSIASWALCVWGAGAVFFFSSILSSIATLRKLLRGAHPPGETTVLKIFDSLALSAGAGRKVKLLTSGLCKVPFTFGVLNPVIVLPTTAGRWPGERMRAVLTHELAHVMRMDCLTQLASRIVCSLFWFAPHLWLAHGRLHIEQEKAADAFTVRAGTRPSDYAHYLIDLARVLRRTNPLLAGLFAPGNRKSTLERRVVDILRMQSVRDHGKPHRFLTPRFLRPFALCLLCALSLLLLNPVSKGAHPEPSASAAFAGGARADKAVTGGAKAGRDAESAGRPVEADEAFERIAGTWINEDYVVIREKYCESQKLAVNVDGSIDLWSRFDDMGPNQRWFYDFQKGWIDSDGCLYCQVSRKRTSESIGVTTELWRLDPSSTVLELVFMIGTQDEFPDRIDPSPAVDGHAYYWIYYRA